jgi:MFS family permease
MVSDYGSGLYGTFFSTGQILAPIVGSAVYEMLDYRYTTDVMTAACLIWCLIFFTFNVGFNIIKEEKANHDKLKAGQEALLLTKEDYKKEIGMDEDSPKV